MKIDFWKAYRAINQGEKLPRKIKKIVLGKRLNKSQLRKLINSVEITYLKDEEPYITPYIFCPECGCTVIRHVNHGVPYPEIWVDDYCARCGSWVGGADNSFYHHVLEDLGNEEI